MLKISLCLLCTALLCGCASESTTRNNEFADAKVGTRSDRICTTETKTGSFIPKRVCRTKAQKEEDKEFADKVLDTVRSSPNLVP